MDTNNNESTYNPETLFRNMAQRKYPGQVYSVAQWDREGKLIFRKAVFGWTLSRNLSIGISVDELAQKITDLGGAPDMKNAKDAIEYLIQTKKFIINDYSALSFDPAVTSSNNAGVVVHKYSRQ